MRNSAKEPIGAHKRKKLDSINTNKRLSNNLNAMDLKFTIFDYHV